MSLKFKNGSYIKTWGDLDPLKLVFTEELLSLPPDSLRRGHILDIVHKPEEKAVVLICDKDYFEESSLWSPYYFSEKYEVKRAGEFVFVKFSNIIL